MNTVKRAIELRNIRRAIRGEIESDLSMDELLVAEAAIMRTLKRVFDAEEKKVPTL